MATATATSGRSRVSGGGAERCRWHDFDERAVGDVVDEAGDDQLVGCLWRVAESVNILFSLTGLIMQSGLQQEQNKRAQNNRERQWVKWTPIVTARSQYKAPPNAAVMGSVKIQASMIFSPNPQRTPDSPRVAPRPKIDPVIVWVVEVGKLYNAAIVRTSEALVSAAKPSVGPSFVR